ncbi:hypothetical protein LJC26_00855 [Desulfovibrio sp. OttesenSCG-928-O18]|nr:hypothetical protein [Desulfovibrio sp. OttesenSCG-928-O18]
MNQTIPAVTFLYMPIDGIAAYWLSLRKLLGNSRNMRTLEAEAQFVAEPFVRHLLDMLMSQISPARCRQLAETCGQSELDRLDRQFDLIRVAIMDMATGENPLRTLVRITARFPAPIADPEAMLETAQGYLEDALNGTLSPEACRIDHNMSDEALALTLLFYATLCRRHGKAACRPFLPQEGSAFFTDALSLVVDGFDAPFIRKWMKRFKTTILDDMQRKISLSTDMCLAIQERVPFEEMRFLVRSYIR